MNLFVLLLGQQGGEEGTGPSFFIMLGLMFVVFYFFMIRPQAKKAKEAKKFREALGKGTKVVTIGGIHGKIVEVQDTTVTLEIGGQMKLKVEKSAISPEYSSGSGTSTLQQSANK